MDLEFKIGSKNSKEQFYVTGLGKQRIILSFPWLRKHNPKIDWKTGKIEWELQKLDFRQWCGRKKNPKPTVKEQLDKEERKTQMINPIKEEMNTLLLELMDKTIVARSPTHHPLACHITFCTSLNIKISAVPYLHP